MKRVERKGFNSKREMEVMDALNEVKQLNKRQGKVNHEELLLKTLSRWEESDQTQDEEFLKVASGKPVSSEEDLKKKFFEMTKYRRIDDLENRDNFDSMIEIEDPYELLKQL